jgi:hypothetical protein
MHESQYSVHIVSAATELVPIDWNTASLSPYTNVFSHTRVIDVKYIRYSFIVYNKAKTARKVYIFILRHLEVIR